MTESQPFKDFYGVELAEDLARRIETVYAPFPSSQVVAQVAANVAELELKGRVASIAAALRAGLPPAYPEALAILMQVVGPEIAQDAGMFNEGWRLMPIAYFVEVYGLDYWAASMDAIHTITRRHTGEFAIRPYLERYPEATLARLHEWAQDENAHVRRLVSEGTRTRLPWGRRLEIFVRDPEPVLALLQMLRDDPSAYVRKSVANNLNDIAKDHPERVLELLRVWQAEGDENRRWIVRHALRTLVKRGHPGALALLGYREAVLQVQQFFVQPRLIRAGDRITLSLTLRNADDLHHAIVIDYRLLYQTTSGRPGARVYKWTTLTLPMGETAALQKNHRIRSTTTRTLHPGRHVVEVQVNGRVLAEDTFELQP